MYTYVEDKEFLKEAQSVCSGLVREIEVELRETKEINSQMFLVGSGGRNMITQNGNEGIDFDYNLNILSCPDWKDTRGIKEAVRQCFNTVMRNHRLPDVEDSRSSLTSKPISFTKGNQTSFHIDLAIVTEDEGCWHRLIHEKTGLSYYDRWIWNKAPHSDKIREKADKIKKAGKWLAVRERYLEKKNYYLRRNDHDHPSFVCYIETVNEIYQTLR
ncbi:MAG: hypothetical protein J5563_00985 [Clostridia bacterium]|nr:hypothetical protein [Clostridia bacterium]